MTYEKPRIAKIHDALRAVQGHGKLRFVHFDCILLIPFFASAGAYEEDE